MYNKTCIELVHWEPPTSDERNQREWKGWFTDHKTQIVKMSMLPKLTHTFNKIFYQNLSGIFCRYGQDYSKMHREKQRNGNT